MSMDVDDEDINVQDLQAQVDLSMSFASSLAASWIKPRRSGANTSSRRLEMEKEIWEAAKRPSRLGVGTPVSQASQNTSREAARLKGQLVGKRTRQDDDGASKKDDGNERDGDDESRAGAIKKRAKLDPFEVSSKKKKKQSLQVMVEGASSSVVASTAEKLSKASLEDSATKPMDNVTIPFKPFAPNWEAPDSPANLASSSGLGRIPSNQQGEGQSATLHSLSPSEEATSTQEDHPKPAFLALVTPLSPSAKLPPELLKRPLLNLSDHSGSEGEAPENASPSSSPKKKRKRKKKKKKLAAEAS